MSSLPIPCSSLCLRVSVVRPLLRYNTDMTPAPLRNAVALLVGIGYGHSAGIAPLRFASRDARALARLVADPRVCAFPRDKVALLTDGKEIGRASCRESA